ncbi:MAG: hypothetical protein IKC72_02195 [Clostridia bacterium]|nr:hypothetical protein [Clostridia bacterium]
MTIEYLISFMVSVALLVAYLVMIRNKEFWLTMLYASVPVINLGYTLLSVAKTTAFAIFANDVVYLGSVFLSMFMFLTIVRLCGFTICKKHVIVCLSLGVVMFLMIATSGILPWYYKSVSLEVVDGVTRLVKEYGVLHPLYLVYLLGYFCAMIVTIVHAVKSRKIAKIKHAAFISGIVCSNLLVWIFEKFIQWDYEFLSVTYIISELLLLLVYWMMQDYVHKSDVPTAQVQERISVIFVDSSERAGKVKQLLAQLPDGVVLTARQIDILEGILAGKSRKEMAVDLHLSENTVKMHTTSLFKALKVSSREEIIAMIEA